MHIISVGVSVTDGTQILVNKSIPPVVHEFIDNITLLCSNLFACLSRKDMNVVKGLANYERRRTPAGTTYDVHTFILY